jgi:hypothetical protein
MTLPTANPAIALFNYYRRYKWSHTDFGNLQSAIMDSIHGVADGAFHGVVLQGLGLVSATGLNFTVDGGIACGPTGNLLVNQSAVTGSLAAPTGSQHASRSLVVIRPNPVSANNITNPLSPFNSVPLNTLQEASIVVLSGTEGTSPSYPATVSGDVVLFGVRLATGDTTVSNEKLDYEVSDLIGKNSQIKNNTGKYDDRLRPYRSSNNTLGIKPSQLSYPLAQAFSFGGFTQPSIFPKTSGGAFNPADALYNFQTGAVSGGDQVSSSFTPTIPSAGNAIVASVYLTAGDTVSVVYGTAGTRLQCYNAIINQTYSSAGSLSAVSSGRLICYVLLNSLDGSNISGLDVFDVRGPEIQPYQSNVQNVTGAATGSVPTNVYLLDPTGGAFNFTMPLSANNKNWRVTLKNIAIGSANAVTILRSGSDTLEQQTSYSLGAGEVLSLMADGTSTYWQV